MRLLITTDTVGGVWTYTQELSEGLLLRGHDVLLISMGRLPSYDQSAWTARTRARSPRTFRYLATEHPLEWMQTNEACYRAAEAILMKQAKYFAPDVLHLNQFCYGALPTNIPKIVIAHSDVLSWSESCHGASPADGRWLQQYLRVVKSGLAQAQAVVAPTRWMLDALSRNYSLPVRQAVIANGRKLSPTGLLKRRLQAVTIGRVWDEGKNVRVLEKVTSPLPILVAGELALEAEPPFTSTRLQLLGQLSEAATLALFAESAIYIATSLYEPFGLAPLEAAICGCAIVAHDIPSLREVWGDDALYFKNAEELTLQLDTLTTNGTLLKRTATKACIRARTLYSRDAMIDNYLELYATLGVPVELAEAEHVS